MWLAIPRLAYNTATIRETSMTEPLVVSQSEITTWQRCKRKWNLEYYRKLHKIDDPPVGNLALGTRVHAALAAYYGEGKDLLVVHKELCEADVPLIAGTPFEAEFYADAELGAIMLEGYLDWITETGEDASFTVIGTEKKVEIPLLDGAVTFKGTLDLRLQHINGSRLFMDHKTTDSISRGKAMLEMNQQALSYGVIERTLLDPGEWSSGAIWNFLRKVKRTKAAKPPFYERAVINMNDDQLRAHWTHLHANILDIMAARRRLDSGSDWHAVCPPTPTSDCVWQCSFASICVMADDGSAFEGALAASFESHDPYLRYQS